MEAKVSPELPVVLFGNNKAWRTWLSKHYGDSSGLWLQLAKKPAGRKTVSYQEALETALCYGWVDSQKKPLDEEYWLQKFTPRGARSIWSKINRTKTLELIEQGLMHKAGLAAIERAKANGKWEAAYDSQKTAALPADFEKALKRRPKAKEFFRTLNSVNRYAILFRIHTAKKPETREKRIAKFLDMLERHEKIHP